MRSLIIFLIVFTFSSCDYFSFKKNKHQEKINMDIDYGSVDSSPSFKVCDSIIDKEKKTSCFESTLRTNIFSSLAKNSIKVKKEIDETIIVSITIQSDKKVKLSSIKVSEKLVKLIPNLKEMIEKSIQDLPEIYPALKRGIPVTTAYKLPIRIKL